MTIGWQANMRLGSKGCSSTIGQADGFTIISGKIYVPLKARRHISVKIDADTSILKMRLTG
jgi:hypothetical protein